MSDNRSQVLEEPIVDEPAPRAQAPQHGFLSGLYTGTGGFRIVGRRKMFYIVAAVLVLIALLSIVLRGFTLGIEFAGGTKIELPTSGDMSTSQVEETFADALGHDPVSVQKVGSGSSASYQIRAETLDAGDQGKAVEALFDAYHPKDQSGQASRSVISVTQISETWGGQITQKAIIALAVFIVLTMVYIAIRFERDMSIAAVASLLFNLVVTAGIYSIVGFEVTPAAVIGLLTVLGYVLYDNVVVFDKVEENTRGVLHLTRRTYGEQANLAANQTLMRSINTTVIGILPIIGMLVVAVWLLGVGMLKDLALVQLVGMIVGAYSSIFFAVPLLVSIKERFGPVAAHTKKVLAKRAPGGTEPTGRRVGGAPVGARARGGSEAPAPETPRPGARPTGKRHKRRH